MCFSENLWNQKTNNSDTKTKFRVYGDIEYNGIAFCVYTRFVSHVLFLDKAFEERPQTRDGDCDIPKEKQSRKV